MFFNYFHSFLSLFIVAALFSTSFANYSIPTHFPNMSLPREVLSINCATCHREIQYAPVKSNANGNQGRWLAKCLNRNPETGETCNMFRWLPGSRSPSLSPLLASNTQLPAFSGPEFLASSPTLRSQATHLSPSLPAPHKSTCPTLGCNSTRIRKGCGRRMCKAHCIEAGGCVDPAHKSSHPMSKSFMVAASPPTPLPSVPAAPPSNTFSMNLDPRLYQSTVAMAPPRLSPPSTTPIHTRMEPAFASHMSEIFSTQIALEETLREKGRQMEATRLESKRKAQQTVFVYAWMEDGCVPAPFEVQEGFAWPHFILNEAILSSAGFMNISINTCFNIFRFSLGHWTTVKLNHVVDLKDSPRVFIKATHVQYCENFKSFLASTSSTTEPSVRRNLAGERGHVKRNISAHELSQASTSSVSKRPHTISSDDEPPARPARPQPTRGSHSHAATCVVRRKMSEYAQMLCYESDSGIEFTEPRPFSNQTRTPPRQSSSTASTSKVSSQSITPTIKPQELESAISYVPPNGHLKNPRWPRDFFAVDIVNCFNDANEADDERVCQVFEAHFGRWVPYVRSTFYEHRGRWQQASLEAKHVALSAGRTASGYWANFMLTNPAPRSRLKAARKRNNSSDEGEA
ncbi:hypothetical protein BYT27DRAFT_7167355 [Phlegmacium glaucopus]|nr:hypothetical protein BYT27DRAFT_7167355 [Phlegmacium glaucopus]